MPGKSRVPSRNRATATSSAAISAAEARGPAMPASRAMRSAGKRASSGARKSSRAGRDEVGRGRRRRPAVGVGQGVLDRESHVGGAQLGLEGAVDEPDGGVDDALRVDDHLDRVVVDIVQPVRLDDLQALVGEGRRVDRDLGAHRPGRVPQGLLRGHGGQLVGAWRRGTGRRDAVRTSAATVDIDSPTRHCQMAECSESIGRSQASGLANGSRGRGRSAASRRGRGHDEVAAGDQRLLVGRGHDLAGAQRGEDRPQADDAAGGDDDEVDVVARRELDRAHRRPRLVPCPAGRSRLGEAVAGRQRDDRRPELRRLLGERRAIRGRPPSRDDRGRLRVRRRGPRPPGVRSSRSSRGSATPRGGSGEEGDDIQRHDGAANRNESTRSSIPPWPGMSVPESLAPAARLSIDSARSPAWAASAIERPEQQARGAATGRAPRAGSRRRPRSTRRRRRRGRRRSWTARCGSGTSPARTGLPTRYAPVSYDQTARTSSRIQPRSAPSDVERRRRPGRPGRHGRAGRRTPAGSTYSAPKTVAIQVDEPVARVRPGERGDGDEDDPDGHRAGGRCPRGRPGRPRPTTTVSASADARATGGSASPRPSSSAEHLARGEDRRRPRRPAARTIPPTARTTSRTGTRIAALMARAARTPALPSVRTGAGAGRTRGGPRRRRPGRSRARAPRRSRTRRRPTARSGSWRGAARRRSG